MDEHKGTPPISFLPGVRIFQNDRHVREPADAVVPLVEALAADFPGEPKDVVRLALTAQPRDSGIQVPKDGVGLDPGRAALVAAVDTAAVVVLVVLEAANDVLFATVPERFAASFFDSRQAALQVSAVVEPEELQDRFSSAAE